MIDFLDKCVPYLIVFFLWRISSHLKAIRKSLAGKLLFDTINEAIFNKKKKEDEE